MANIKSIGGNPIVLDASGIAAGAVTPDKLEDMGGITAGAAHGITGNGPTESAAWLQRVSTSDGPTIIRGIHGRTLRWNQLYNALTFTYNAASGAYGIVADGTGKWTVTINEGGTSGDNSNISAAALPSSTFTAGHKYLITTNNANITLFLKAYNTRTNTIFTASAAQYNNVALAFTDLAAGTYVLYPQLFDLTAMFGSGNEPSTIEEFTALYPLPYYEYDAGSFLPVSMVGIKTTGFNQWDEEWELGAIAVATGQNVTDSNTIRSKNYNSCFPNTDYYIKGTNTVYVFWYDAEKNYIGNTYTVDTIKMSPANAAYFRVRVDNVTTYKHDICINLSDPTRNGTYVPYWHQTSTIPAGTLRSAGSVYDELTETERITRVGEITLDGSSDESYADAYSVYGGARIALQNAGLDASDPSTQIVCDLIAVNTHRGATSYVGDDCLKTYSSASDSGVIVICKSGVTSVAELRAWLASNPITIHYALATPTVTPHEQPLNMTYRTEQGGTERVMVPTGENSAPPTIVAAQGYTAESLRDAALATIAPVENGTASTNYGVGSYLVHGGQLCKVTTAIATGEAITIGTNVTTTTVMAEVLSLTQ